MGRSQDSPVRIGLAALCANWFKEIGLQGDSDDLGRIVDQDYKRMVGFLGECLGEVVAPGVICTVAEAQRAAEQFARAGIDALLLVHIMWSEDQPLLALLDALPDVPIVLWNYHPTGRLPDKLAVNDLFRHSGTVGMLQGSSPMQRRNLAPHIVTGAPGDAGLAEALRRLGLALGIHKEFRGLRAGRIAGRCEVMTGTYVDADALHSALGAELVEITATEYAAACDAVSGNRVEAFHADISATYPVEGVGAESLRLACRNTLALDDLVDEHDLKALAIQDLDEELHRLAGIRPCLCPPRCAARGVAIAMESDLNAALGMRVGMRALGRPCMYAELFTYDPGENIVLMGHAGVHDPRLAADDGVTIVPDMEYRNSDRLEGAWQEFILTDGPVTCISLYDTGGGYRMTVFEGESLGAPRRIQGFAHAAVRPDVGVVDLLGRLVRRGMTQHFAIAPGRISDVLATWCRLGGVEFHQET